MRTEGASLDAGTFPHNANERVLNMSLSKLHRQATRAAAIASSLNEDRSRRRTGKRQAPAKAVKVIPLKHIFAAVKLGENEHPTHRTVEADDKAALAGILHSLAAEWGMCEIIAVYRA